MAGETLNLSQHIGGISITDGDQYARVDMTTGALEVMEYEHHEIHAGSLYSVSWEADVAGNATFGLMFSPASTSTTAKKCHALFHSDTELEGQIELWEGITHGGAGTAVGCHNHRRINGGTATMSVYRGTTSPSTVGCTRLFVHHTGTSSGRTTQVGGDVRGENEWILSPSVNYYWMVKNSTDSDNFCTLWASWYEHTDKDELTLIV